MAGKIRNICVVGAGFLGLPTAVNIVENITDVEVTLIAENVTPGLISDEAAGLWWPYLLPPSTPVHLQRRWGKDTFDHLQALTRSPEGSAAGVSIVSGYTLLKSKEKDPYWSDIVLGYRHMTEQELKQFSDFSFKFGYTYTTFIAEGKSYLPWLTRRFESKGGKIIREKVDDIKKLGLKYDVVVNCTGLGAGQLLGDKEVQPIKGQILKVKAPWTRHFITADEIDLYIIPNNDYIVLGGTHDTGVWDTKASDADRERIWQGCCKLSPGLRNGKIVGDWVGLRPGRSSIRVEKEIIPTKDKQIKVVHNYGHGGAGITLHWGCALHATELVKECLSETKAFSKL